MYSQVGLDFFDGSPKLTVLFYTFAISRYMNVVSNMQGGTVPATQKYFRPVRNSLYITYTIILIYLLRVCIMPNNHTHRKGEVVCIKKNVLD